MRHVLMFIFFLILAYGPTVFYSIGKKNQIIKNIVLYSIPTIFMVFYACFLFKVFAVDSLFLCLANMIFIICFLPLNLYLLCRGIYSYVKRKKGKELKWINRLGVVLSILILVVMLKGFLDRKDLQVRQVSVEINGLPEAFDGLKIVQISDLHLGNIDGLEDYLLKVVELSNECEPDMVFLTGDLLNIMATEGIPAIGILNQLEAKYGKYAVLGNHDYGKYYKWDSVQDSLKNMEDVTNLFGKLDFDLLLNEHRLITIGEDSLVVAGTENCGEKPFPCYADLPMTMFGVEHLPTILLTHDPSHWRNEVLDYSNILLTCSGHTHGAQMGIEIGDFKVSPAQIMYSDWDGLYYDNGQYLFISRGVGYVGVPFRLGMKPEISVLKLVAEEDFKY